jgi:hypothetical protein
MSQPSLAPLVPCPDQCGSFTTAEHAEQVRAATALHHVETEVEDAERVIEPVIEQAEQEATGPKPVADVPAEAAAAAGQDPFAQARVIRLGPAW